MRCATLRSSKAVIPDPFLSVDLRVSGAAQELPLSGAAQEPVFVDDHLAAGKNRVWHSSDLNSLKHRIIHTHVMRLGTDGVLALGIKNHQVGVAADGDGSLARIQTEQFCWGGGDEFNETVHAETAAADAARVNQAHAMF